MDPSASRLIGVGLYTIPEAARLTGIPTQSIRRWIIGYQYRRDRQIRRIPPVYKADGPSTDDETGLSFLDLLEIRFIHAFRGNGISLQAIRRAAQLAQELFQRDHPFSRKKFSTDGRRIFAEIAEETGETKLLDLVRSQYAFHQVVQPSLYRSLEFDEHEDVRLWYPQWPKRQVLIDPARAFGRPIVAAAGVPTETLAQAVKVEGSAERVARWYDVSVAAVRSAVEFEQALVG